MFKRLTWIALSAALLLATAVGPALAGAPEGLDWLRARQNDDGGFGGDFDTASSPGATAEAVLAIVAAGEDPAAWAVDGQTPLTYLQSQVDPEADAGTVARLILVAVAAGTDPRDFGGGDLVAALEGSLGDNGLYGGEAGSIFSQALSILALRSAGRPIPAEAVAALTDVQIDNGSWSWNGDTAENAGDSNTTAVVVQALLAAGGQDEAVAAGLDYLRGLQNEDGGFPYQKPSDFGTDTDANSTAAVIQALAAAGIDPASVAAAGGASPLDALAALQKENGAFQWQAAVADDNFLATVQAIPALAGKDILQVVGAIEAGEAAAEPAPAPAELPASGGPGSWPALAVGLAGLFALSAGIWLRRGGLA